MVTLNDDDLSSGIGVAVRYQALGLGSCLNCVHQVRIMRNDLRAQSERLRPSDIY